MKRALLILFSASLTASAAPIFFTTLLSGNAEEPSNASPGAGLALVTIDPVAHTLAISIQFSGLLGTTTASHIHVINGPGDANMGDTVGPVATATPSFPGFPAGVTSGTYDMTFDTLMDSTYRAGWITDSGGSAALAEAALFAGILEGRAYVNIHSSVFPGGEIRGFLEPVPEPATFVLSGLGLLALGLCKRRFANYRS